VTVKSFDSLQASRERRHIGKPGSGNVEVFRPALPGEGVAVLGLVVTRSDHERGRSCARRARRWESSSIGSARASWPVHAVPGGPAGGPEFILIDGELYLLRQKMKRKVILVTGVNRIDWSDEDIRRLRKNHPEIDRDELWQERENE